jgi:hypothetical protein
MIRNEIIVSRAAINLGFDFRRAPENGVPPASVTHRTDKFLVGVVNPLPSNVD